MPAGTKKYGRVNFIVDARFQIKHIAYILMFLYIGAAIAGYTVYSTAWSMLGDKLAGIYPTGRLLYIFKAAQAKLMFRLLLITPVFVIIGILLSHRIAGPVYVMGKYVDSLVQGKYSDVLKLRKYDELKYLAGKLGVLCYKLRDDRDKRESNKNSIIEGLRQKGIGEEIIKEVSDKL